MLYDDDDLKRAKAEAEEPDLGRSPFRRDFGRLLHSPAFRRLLGKTQLFPGHESDFFRNRLTHSLEVAQVAKGIALNLNANCPELRASPDAFAHRRSEHSLVPLGMLPSRMIRRM